MASLVPNIFSKYAFINEEEELEAHKLTHLQVYHIRNQMAAYAEELICLQVDTANYDKFLQGQARLQGSIAAMQYLLDLSEAVISSRN